MRFLFNKDRFKWLFIILFFSSFFLFCLPAVFYFINNFSLSSLTKVLTSARTIKILGNTIFMALLSSLLSLTIAFVLFLFISSGKFRFKYLFLSVSHIPFVMPSLVLLLSFISIFGAKGFIKVGNIYSLKSVIILHSFYNFPLILHSVYTRYLSFDLTERDCALTLGATKFRAFVCITTRQLMPSIISSTILVFMYCFSSFSIPILLGGIKGSTLETEIYRCFKILGDTQDGISYSILSFFVMFCVSLLYKKIKSFDKYQIKKTKIEFKKKDFKFSILSLLLSFFIVFPFLRIFNNISSSSENINIILEIFFVFKKNINAVCISFFIATFSSLITVFVSFVFSEYINRHNFIDFSLISFIPLCISDVFLSSSFSVIGFSNFIYSFLVLVLLHSFMLFPVVYKIVDTYISSLDKKNLVFPLTLGSDELKAVFLVDFPSSIKCLKQAYIIGFCMSLGEVTYSLMITQGKFQTLSSVMFQYINRYNFSAATCIAVVIMILVVTTELITNNKMLTD